MNETTRMKSMKPMTKQQQYARDLARAAGMVESQSTWRDALDFTGSSAKLIKEWDAFAARLRNYGCLNPFDTEKKGRKK